MHARKTNREQNQEGRNTNPHGAVPSWKLKEGSSDSEATQTHAPSRRRPSSAEPRRIPSRPSRTEARRLFRCYLRPQFLPHRHQTEGLCDAERRQHGGRSPGTRRRRWRREASSDHGAGGTPPGPSPRVRTKPTPCLNQTPSPASFRYRKTSATPEGKK